jgi:hypothetical protein
MVALPRWRVFVRVGHGIRQASGEAQLEGTSEEGFGEEREMEMEEQEQEHSAIRCFSFAWPWWTFLSTRGCLQIWPDSCLD